MAHTYVCYVLMYTYVCYEPEMNLFSGCTPIGLWFLSRHGTRHTGDDDVADMNRWFPVMLEQINQAHAEGRGKLSKRVFQTKILHYHLQTSVTSRSIYFHYITDFQRISKPAAVHCSNHMHGYITRDKAYNRITLSFIW